VENIPDFLNGPADYVLQELLRVARTLDVPVLIDGENSGLNGSWPLLQAAKAGRQGLALQPDQMDGDSIFRTSFPRLTRTEFPPGRALFVRNGRAVKVQVAMPE
jgi:S-DNA-T family DNA segregation ATPase FtsK/SpoIIIE